MYLKSGFSFVRSGLTHSCSNCAREACFNIKNDFHCLFNVVCLVDPDLILKDLDELV